MCRHRMYSTARRRERECMIGRRCYTRKREQDVVEGGRDTGIRVAMYVRYMYGRRLFNWDNIFEEHRPPRTRARKVSVSRGRDSRLAPGNRKRWQLGKPTSSFTSSSPFGSVIGTLFFFADYELILFVTDFGQNLAQCVDRRFFPWG